MSAADATVYARALYDAATEANAAQTVGKDLANVVAALSENTSLVRVLFNPAVATEGKARVLHRLTDEAHPLVGKALRVMLDNGRLSLLPDLERAYAERYRAEHDEISVHLTTAVPIDDAQAEALRRRLEEATGQTVQLRRVVDPEIIGGVVLRVRDLLVDASIRRRLERLRRSLETTRLPA